MRGRKGAAFRPRGVRTGRKRLRYADRKVLNDFKDKVADIRHRKALSCFFTQMSMSTVIMMAQRKALMDPVGEKEMDVMRLPGTGNHDLRMEGPAHELNRVPVVVVLLHDGRVNNGPGDEDGHFVAARRRAAATANPAKTSLFISTPPGHTPPL